jgi:hypothetical protein
VQDRLYRPPRSRDLEAQLGPVLSTDSPDALRDAIKRAFVEVLEKISEWTQGAASAATGEPTDLPTRRLRSLGLRLRFVKP